MTQGAAGFGCSRHVSTGPLLHGSDSTPGRRLRLSERGLLMTCAWSAMQVCAGVANNVTNKSIPRYLEAHRPLALTCSELVRSRDSPGHVTHPGNVTHPCTPSCRVHTLCAT